MEAVRTIADRVGTNVERVIVGKRREVQFVLVALLCRGHVLIEDVPGVGKTVLAKAIARSIGCTFRRIQFTPDLLPSDVTGVSIYNQVSGAFEYRPGPVMAQIVLADEINRATPKTQSALLESMEEQQVTVDGVTHPLPEPFIVLATENPIEYEGTFPLPEAQLDRFFVKAALGYPSADQELEIVDDQRDGHPLARVQAVVSMEEIATLQDAVSAVYVDPLIERWMIELVRATRSADGVAVGASVRGSLALDRAVRAWALLHDRGYVTPVDVEDLFLPVIAHRIVFTPLALAEARRVGWAAMLDDFRSRCLEMAPPPLLELDEQGEGAEEPHPA
jgi:MoxR-like ATPase